MRARRRRRRGSRGRFQLVQTRRFSTVRDDRGRVIGRVGRGADGKWVGLRADGLLGVFDRPGEARDFLRRADLCRQG